ncbi:NADH dehydrogenase [ubiquinone] 1 beta subcomplex subunit 7 [Euwallacea similis]|uniref:NADH dehydrogenase [ubiquinone] 1 beta subcomplex subunit 7 n=1 Tax=Euwallacea similis TaxID=1736056 RepID=UPI00344CD11A
MGNSMGNVPTNTWNRYMHPEITPGPEEEPTFDPLLGFPNGRKIREPPVSEAELISARIDLDSRGYCSDKLIEFHTCRAKNYPFVVNCAHEKHAYLTCRHEDFIIRMKEYERERRLRVKKQEKLKEIAAQGA